MHDVFALEQPYLTLCYNFRNLIYRNFSQNAMISNLWNDTLLNNLAAEAFDHTTEVRFSLMPSVWVSTKPQFGLKRN
ncbi:hypothetical protein DSCOOX_30870 [Desulfosarcina ovata subsp. ovata]|uniref:Uncharacterized protein n=1 Tax=Desulfosarcina ovata subsp. ovata TaxID=2752305 RepID=A0A5K8ABD7_9BACT|nr:hypothetical protein DSCOOX_30870 [Desulfosarcina ovata subsp. ovata]